MKRPNTSQARATRPTTIRLALTVAILAALTPMIALAADPAPAPSPDPQAAPAPAPAAAPKNAAQAAKTETQTLEGMVVTGSASNNGVKKIDASYIITAVNAEQIKQANPKSTADLLKVSPGLWPESTGGQTGANIEIAGFPGGGDAPYFTTMMMGSPLYGAPTLSFFETTSAFRLDDTIERAEIVQGGPTVVLGPGQIGATANFILKQGTSEPSGSIGITYGDEGLWRLDGFYGFKIADGWYGSVGGFWRTSDGVRSPGFKADQGGQLTATLTHDLDNGSLMLYARRLDDKNQFITPIPVIQTGTSSYKAYPGFDPLTDTYYSKAIQHVTLPGYPGGGTTADLANGRGAKMNFFGANFDYELPGGWALSDKFNYVGGDMDTNALFSGNNPKPLSYYLYGCNVPNAVFCGPNGALDSDNLNLAKGTVVNANYVGGGAVDPNQSVVHQGWWYIHKHLKSLTNEFRISKEIFEGNTLTAGVYLAHYTDDDKWALGNQMLMSNTPNARPITVSYVDPTTGQTKYQTDSQGFLDYGSYNITEKGAANNKAFYLSDSWRIDRWQIDAGVRIENESAHLLVCNLSPRDLDNNPNNLYNKGVPTCNGTFARTDYDKTHPAFSIGANYEIADNMSAYARVTKGPHFGDFDNTLRGNTTGNTPPVQKMQGGEIGFKYQSDWIYADISAYHRQFSGLTYQPNVQGVPDGPVSTYGSDSKGVNIVGTITPIENLKIGFVGNYLDGVYSHYNGCIQNTDINGKTVCTPINGVQLQRQPKVHFAITPSYRVPFDWGDVTAFVTYTHVGNHTQDQSGLQQLGSYSSWDFGVVANYGKNWEFRVQGTNLSNEFGLTESNSRFFGGTVGLDGTILARPLEGREINVQAKYKF